MTTAILDHPAANPLQQQLTTAQDLFIRRWGEMGQTWGINRTMAEIHALLYITGLPQSTDDVMERLNISRGNASMNLRALCDWGIIRRVHRRGERREYFESLGDVWEMFSIIAAERKRREMDPVLEDHQAVPAHARRGNPGQERGQAGGGADHPSAPGRNGRIHGRHQQDLPAVHRQRPLGLDPGRQSAVESVLRNMDEG